MKIRAIALACALGPLAMGGPVLAQTSASQTVPGYYALAPQTNCPVGPCFIQYGSTVPTSASISGFTPNGNVANLSVTTASGNVALPAGTVAAVLNSGAADASIKLSVGAGSAATTDFVLKSGATVGLTVGSNTFINAITAAGSTTLSIAGGSGLVTGYGGGGSSSGSSGAVFGPTATGSAAANPPVQTGGTINGGATGNVQGFAMKAASTAPAATDPALVVAISPNGAQATAALQPTNAAQGSTTSGQTGPLVQCSVTTAAPTYTTAQTSPLNCTTGGSARVLENNSASILSAVMGAVPAGTNLIGKFGIDQTTPGTTNGVQVNAALPAGTNTIGGAIPKGDTASGATPYGLQSAASTNSTLVSTGAHTLVGINLASTSTTAMFLRFYDGSGAPTCSSATGFQRTIPIPPASSAGLVGGFAVHVPVQGIKFTTGLSFCVTGGGSSTDNTNATTGGYIALDYF